MPVRAAGNPHKEKKGLLALEHDAAVGDRAAFSLIVNDERVDVAFGDFRMVADHRLDQVAVRHRSNG